MTDERDENRMQPGVYDDDRLLSLALGLDDDPELLAAAAADDVLAARLEAMRADVAQIGAQVSAAVPEPAESYTDSSAERWSGLKEFFETPDAATPRRGRRRWWQVAAPVAAVLVVALLVGIVAINGGGGSSGAASDSAGATRTEADAGGAASQSLGGSTVKGSDSGQEATTAPTLGERFADQLNRFAVVVLARAREVSGAMQKFAVLRIFKGSAPKVVELAINGVPADRGRLHLLMLDPTAPPEPEPIPGALSESPWPLDESPLPGAFESPSTGGESSWPEATLSPEPIPSLAAADGPGEPLAVQYTYNGEPTMVRELAPGTDPSTVSLHIP